MYHPTRILHLLIILASFASCTMNESVSTSLVAEMEETNEVEEFTYLALGDSYTIGQSVPVSDRWPNQLATELTNDTIAITEVKIIAQTGWTTGNLLQAIENENPENHDLVSLLIGVNNQFQNQDFEIFENQLEELIEKAIELAGGNKDRVFIVSIPDYGVTPFGANNAASIGAELDIYNEHLRLRSEFYDLPFINITEISRMLENDDQALASDGLHPSGYQYALWVTEMLPVVKDLLSE